VHFHFYILCFDLHKNL
jgi:hypothetical protein